MGFVFLSWGVAAIWTGVFVCVIRPVVLLCFVIVCFATVVSCFLRVWPAVGWLVGCFLVCFVICLFSCFLFYFCPVSVFPVFRYC